jgi:hypothetical protein
MDINDYLIDQSGLDLNKLLSPWHGKLPREFTLWMVNRFGDLFLRMDDGSIWSFRMDEGELSRLADNRDHFADLVNQEDNANEWFLIPLVDQLVAAGYRLEAGQCYGFVVPPVISGEYATKNIRPITLREYYSFLADCYKQIEHLSDGAQVSLKITNLDQAWQSPA